VAAIGPTDLVAKSRREVTVWPMSTTKPASAAAASASAAKPKPKRTAKWHATVNLDRLDAATGRWRITTGKAADPLPRAVATDVAVRASVVAWMSAHQTKHQPEPAASAALEDAIRTSVTAAFRALPPAPTPA
jgi:hypothetical protein